MRITVSHNKPKEEVMRAVDRSFDDLFRNVGAIPLKIVNEHRSWQGSTLNFSFDAKMGLLSTPIKGFVAVTDKDITIDADLGLLEKILPVKSATTAIEGRIRGLLT
jgi:Putative polyhydroxyalkanoic acid system protein (PHA_gran_rgn)